MTPPPPRMTTPSGQTTVPDRAPATERGSQHHHRGPTTTTTSGSLQHNGSRRPCPVPRPCPDRAPGTVESGRLSVPRAPLSEGHGHTVRPAHPGATREWMTKGTVPPTDPGSSRWTAEGGVPPRGHPPVGPMRAVSDPVYGLAVSRRCSCCGEQFEWERPSGQKGAARTRCERCHGGGGKCHRPIEPVLARRCAYCGTRFTPRRARTARFCGSRCAGDWRRHGGPKQPFATCRECGDVFVLDRADRELCSSTCRNRRQKKARGRAAINAEQRARRARTPTRRVWTDAARDAYHRRRARRRAASTGRPVLRTEIAERDGWVCHLCELEVDPSLAWPHPRSTSLDHVVPLAAGGIHDPENVRLAHLACNTAKGARCA